MFEWIVMEQGRFDGLGDEEGADKMRTHNTDRGPRGMDAI